MLVALELGLMVHAGCVVELTDIAECDAFSILFEEIGAISLFITSAFVFVCLLLQSSA